MKSAALIAGLGLVSVGLAACGAEPAKPAVTEVTGPSDIEVGRYLVRTGGCNDCHTPGFPQGGGKTPEAQWLTGNPVGFRGPWGVSYASNLRLTVARMPEDEWVTMLGERTDLPPMPWPSVRAMSENNRRALYRYIKSLGPAGQAAPAALPPGVEPTGPYENMMPVMPGQPAT